MKIRQPIMWTWIVLALLTNLLPVLTPPVGAQPVVTDPRFFSQTGFWIDNDTFWDYFQRRGGGRDLRLSDQPHLHLAGFSHPSDHC